MSETYQLTGFHLIAGQWTQSEGEGVPASDPATGERLEPAFCQAGQPEVDAALGAAAQAFRQTAEVPAARWAALLESLAETIQGVEMPLIARAKRETALPEARLKGELARTTGQLRLFAALVREGSWVDAVLDLADPGRQPLPKPDVRRMLRPVGPVVVFDASNFPFAFGACGGDTASALAAGNPVIVKAHPGHPGTDEIFAAAMKFALEKMGLPSGMFALLQGAGTEIGARLARHPYVESIGFTGSQQGGRALFDLAAQRSRPIPVYAEMGSLNPLVALPAALAERGEEIAAGLAQSVTLGGGQFCTKPGLVLYIGDEIGKQWASLLAERLAVLPSVTLLNAPLQQRLQQTLEQFDRAAGVETKVAGQCAGNADCSPSLREVEAAVWRDSPLLHEETFGPATLLVRCANREDLLATLAVLEGHLTGTLHTGKEEAPELIRAVAGELERYVGRLIFNGYPTGVEVCHAMMHGGPYPATTAAGTTSVGTSAIRRFVRPVAYQNLPDAFLPPALQNANPLGLWRMVNGQITKDEL